MVTTEQANVDFRRVVAVARFLARRTKAKQVGAELLLAGALKAVDEDQALSLLRSAGVGHPETVLQSVPDVGAADFDRLAAVKPDKHLARLLRKELHGFADGQCDVVHVLEVLLAKANRTEAVRRFLTNPEEVLGGPGEAEGTAYLLRALAAFYQRRWLLGRAYLTSDAKTGYSDFVDGGRDDLFIREVDKLYTEQVEAYQQVFSHRLYDRSPLGRCWREHGDVAAHTLGAVLLGEVGQVGEGPLSVREIAWTLSPKYFHRHLSVARKAVQQLYAAGQVQSISGGEVSFLGQIVVPTPDVLDEFLEYLRREDPIRDEEIEDLLKTIY
ncbi:MAG: hypothetical protein H6819_02260 [Phycisphaerales bacterium]|nr:hypothetical protein [Phycisphaerales bacterium]MCB9856964.1 hypothetical protein [Phycisphaerales bacterium]MCB9861909.1 hypothetical protein [Phycisphaerales bacterium]